MYAYKHKQRETRNTRTAVHTVRLKVDNPCSLQLQTTAHLAAHSLSVSFSMTTISTNASIWNNAPAAMRLAPTKPTILTLQHPPLAGRKGAIINTMIANDTSRTATNCIAVKALSGKVRGARPQHAKRASNRVSCWVVLRAAYHWKEYGPNKPFPTSYGSFVAFQQHTQIIQYFTAIRRLLS